MPEHITVVMATYNGERFLKEQLDSLAAQDYPDFDLVVSDDRSTDRTLEIVKSYQNKLPLTLLINEGIKGINGNFENALRLAKGALIAICDQDDTWEPDKLSSLRRALGNNLLVYSDSLLIDEKGNPKGKRLSESKKYRFTGGESPRHFYIYSSMFGHTSLFRRELLERALPFPPTPLLHYDRWLAMLASGKMAYLPKALTRFRIHNQNATHKIEAKEKTQKDRFAVNRHRLEHRLKQLRFMLDRGVLNNQETLFLQNLIAALETKLQKGFSWRFLFLMVLHAHELLHYKNPISGFFKGVAYAFTPLKKSAL